MSVATVHPQPWTVDELYGLPEDGMRHELLDGTLLVSPPPSVSHQLGAARLRSLLAAAAPPEVEVLEAVGVALPAGLLVPDVVVAQAAAVYAGPRQLQARDVLAVAEIVSASSKTADRRWKPEAYAEAGIEVYVRVELDAPSGAEVVIHRLVGDAYRVEAEVRGDAAVEIAVPFPVTIIAAALTGPSQAT